MAWRMGPLTMTFDVFPGVIDIHRACCSEFAFTVMARNLYRLACHSSPCGLHKNIYLAGLTGVQLRVKTPSPIAFMKGLDDT